MTALYNTSSNIGNSLSLMDPDLPETLSKMTKKTGKNVLRTASYTSSSDVYDSSTMVDVDAVTCGRSDENVIPQKMRLKKFDVLTEYRLILFPHLIGSKVE